MKLETNLNRTSGAIYHHCMLGAILLLSACNGILGGIYDNDDEPEAKQGQFYVDASSWTKWYYIDFDRLSTGDVNQYMTVIDVPTDTLQGDSCSNGIYTYWYDVYGEGLDNHRFVSYYRTAAQPEPASWTIAIHRNNVRTNGGAVFETDLTNFDQLPDSLSAFKDSAFVSDTWNETDVWVRSDKMTSGLIGNQGIMLNTVLSGWLKVYIPPIPPAFTHNGHIFILRTKDGQYFAIQLLDYMSPSTGTKCCLTVKVSSCSN